VDLVQLRTLDDATKALLAGDIEEYFVIPSDYVSTGVVRLYTLKKQLEPPPDITMSIRNFLLSNLLAGKVPAATLARVEAPLNLVSTRLTETGAIAPEQGGFGNLIIPGIFGLLLMLAIVFSSSYLLQGLGEEKENRLIEILLSSVSARQLFTGKVLGIGAAGLTQVGVWAISTPLLLRLASSAFGGFISTMRLPAAFLVLAVVYFILGYLFFAVLSAAVGAVSASSREGQQLITIFTMPLISPLWFMSLLMIFPDNPIWAVLTIIPITAPVLVMLRLGVSDIPAWQLAASMAILVLSIIGMLLLTIKIFRAHLLMYGKRPRLREIIRNLKRG
jgi:ABC-2 type transport system permease protein